MSDANDTNHTIIVEPGDIIQLKEQYSNAELLVLRTDPSWGNAWRGLCLTSGHKERKYGFPGIVKKIVKRIGPDFEELQKISDFAHAAFICKDMLTDSYLRELSQEQLYEIYLIATGFPVSDDELAKRLLPLMQTTIDKMKAETQEPLTLEHVKNICIGSDGEEKTCSFLVTALDGYECAKNDPNMKAAIYNRRISETMQAMGDNCPGRAKY